MTAILPPAAGPESDPAWLRSFRRRLFAWFVKAKRDLPWRRDRDPYRIWISEVMLQQTTVAGVIPFYERFLDRFPDVASLAAASEHDVMRLWEGLGYYSRARNLHAAARWIVDEHAGSFPRTAAELAELKGIGRYTAGAVASFAFDDPAPIVEANTLRLYSRLLAYQGDPRSTEGQKRLWSFAERIVPRKHAGRFNHALMDLGATVCTVRAPKCESCPVRPNCGAFAHGLQNVIPLPKPRPVVTDVTEAYVVVRKGGDYLLRRRSPGERWSGLWDFPRYELTAEEASECHSFAGIRDRQKSLPLDADLPAEIGRSLARKVAEQTGVTPRDLWPFAELRHGITRYRMRVICFDSVFHSGGPADPETVRWVAARSFGELALSRTGRRLAETLVKNG